MQPSSTTTRAALRRRFRRLACAGALSLSFCGCATFWDDVTSHDFTVGSLFTSKDPIVVLRDSKDGSERARALAVLEEPVTHGGNQQQHETALELLRSAALKDEQPLCRMTAVRTLGRWRDPRAAETVDAVYVQNLTFGQEMNGLIRQECLAALADAGGPVALRRLVLVAKEPSATGNTQDRQETHDRRLTAVRGLGKFKAPEAVEALAYVLKSEKDVALRNKAQESMEASTGKRLPAEVAGPILGPSIPEHGHVQPAGAIGSKDAPGGEFSPYWRELR